MSYDVICAGSALLDVLVKSGKFTKVPSGDFSDGVALCEEYGGKSEVDALVVATGGAGTNNAVSFKRKGLNTALIAEVGKDLVAATIKEELNREVVDISMLSEVQGEETGLSVILIAPDGGRSALIYRGASKMLTKEDIHWDQVRANWLYLSTLGGDLALMEGLIGHGKTYGMKVVVNPGMGEIDKLRRQETRYRLEDLFQGIEVLMMNREEAAALTGLPLEDDSAWRGTWTIPGPRWLVVTDGKNGGMVTGEGRQLYYEAEKCQVVEETGAGDAFGSGFVYALIQGKEIETAVKWGLKQSVSVISFMGAKQGLLTKEVIES
jgi:sugar/nucleoside kinase (ribokinase family)